MKTINLFLLAIFAFASLSTAHAQEITQDSKKAILGKWQYHDLDIDLVTSDSAATEQMQLTLASALTASSEVMRKMILDFTEDGKILSNMGYNKTYWIDGDKLFMKEANRTDEVSFKIVGDTLIQYTDMKEAISNKLEMIKQMGADSGLPEDMVIEKCVSSVYFIRANEESEAE